MKTRLSYCLLIAIGVTIVLSFLFSIGYLSLIQSKLSDNLYGGKQPLDAIVIVAIDDKSLQDIGRWPWDRDVFAEALDKLHGAKVIGMDVAFFEPSGNDEKLSEALKNNNIIIPIEFTSFAEENGRLVGKRLLKPINEFSGAKTGYVNIITDNDGTTRAVNTDLSDDYEAFSSILYKEFWKRDAVKSSRFLVNFVSVPGSFTRYSLSDLVNGEINESVFENKLVLIGATSPDLHDDYFVPLSHGKAMPGVEIHANTVQTLITQDFLQKQPTSSVIALMLIVSMLLAGIFYLSRVWVAAVVALVIAPLYLLLAILLFDKGIIMNVVYVPLSLLFTFGGEVVYFYITEKKAKTEVQKAFSKYVSPAVMHELLKHPEKLTLGGAKKNVTIFFSDIRGFTTISEKLTPEKLVNLLNDYLTEMTNIVMKHEGVVDKFIGDAVMAFWGAPLEEPNHAPMACSTSIDMIERLNELQKKWEGEGFPPIKIGIGLNTGHAVIGNMGSHDRFDYTAMGDCVNLASRLEGLTKQYGVNIIISESTNKAVGKEYVTRKLDLVRVKGKKEPITIYELVCRKSGLSVKKKRLIENFEKGIGLYSQKLWDDAITLFKEVDDFASQMYIERCKTFKKSPPPEDWDGVWVMTTK